MKIHHTVARQMARNSTVVMVMLTPTPTSDDPVEAPAETADQVYHRVEEGGGLPERWQNVDGVEAAAEEDQGRNDQERHELQLLEAVGPDAEQKAEEAKSYGRQQEKRDHPERVGDLDAARTRLAVARIIRASTTDFVAAAPTYPSTISTYETGAERIS